MFYVPIRKLFEVLRTLCDMCETARRSLSQATYMIYIITDIDFFAARPKGTE